MAARWQCLLHKGLVMNIKMYTLITAGIFLFCFFDNSLKSSAPASLPGQNADCFDTIKELIVASPHRIACWQACPKGSDAMKTGSDCGRSVEFLIGSLTKDPYKGNWIRHYALIKNNKNYLVANEFFGSLKNFIQMDEGEFEEDVAHELFSIPQDPEHLFFRIVVAGGKHIFVVEKMSDGKTAWWRIYQSFYQQYSLAQWVGLDAWSALSQTASNNAYYDLYGSGKRVTQDQLMQFITSPFIFGQSVDLDTDFYVKKFQADNTVCGHKQSPSAQ